MSNSSRVVVIQQESNGLGLAGLIFSCIGWVTCGLLCIPGAFLSFLGLFSKGPKGTSIAGLIVGFPGVLFFAFIGSAMLAGFIGIGSVAAVGGAAAVTAANKPLSDLEASGEAASPIDSDLLVDNSALEAEAIDITEEPMSAAPETAGLPLLPETPEDPPMPQEPLIELEKPTPDDTADKPVVEAETSLLLKKKSQVKVELREFSDVSGRFRVQAEFLGLDKGNVKLKKADGTVIEVPLEKLSAGDIAWIGRQSNQ